ncbi:hypothetical protein M409DRAFT_35849 [Zasmidium cellare ATCC 36951]|uniref:Major facilitator superfamily (MFS) profile domain-containing protein n=1 Tax=Zasmidium cellare ATCC 36951 TaxID=1080233 RepID=A0A6A6CUH8_ZASCE|nr:uncharacterized protein M409DRAFT_35849 [Zasmidium cellare ATCC 36951]KAF2170741.1 hypothetical protein M409DRAFT_35849 [Zasmidium cellare ATCC 36951]
MENNKNSTEVAPAIETPPSPSAAEHGAVLEPPRNKLMKLYANNWTQIILISFICFCCPGMYNALTGLGGSGQVDPTVAANANVALLSVTAATALFIGAPLFWKLGPKILFLMGGWTYALYSGSLLNFNHDSNGAFVIAAGAILGLGASFLWVVQGAIMTSYVPEHQKGRAIALFWIIFNLGGGIGSLASFGINFHSTSNTVSSSTYVALMVIMLFGWLLGVFLCSPKRVRLTQLRRAEEGENHHWKNIAIVTFKTIANWRVLLMIPLWFSANVFYSYQQNVVNGETFNIRTRSLNSALYWMSQMFGGLIIGFLQDLPGVSRPKRAIIGWTFVLVTGMAIWGGGYAFQLWLNRRLAQGLKQDIDYTQGSLSAGPMMLYIFYGGYDALWQGFSYWLIGTVSNSSERTAILVGGYKTFQAVGAAMAWRISAQGKSPMTQLGMDWGLCIGSLLIVLPTVLTVSRTTEPEVVGSMPEEKAEEA